MASKEARIRKKRRQAANRRERLELSNREGWKKCSEFHYQKIISGKLVNWWPSRSKCMIENKIYQVFDESDMLGIIAIPSPQ